MNLRNWSYIRFIIKLPHWFALRSRFNGSDAYWAQVCSNCCGQDGFNSRYIFRSLSRALGQGRSDSNKIWRLLQGEWALGIASMWCEIGQGCSDLVSYSVCMHIGNKLNYNLYIHVLCGLYLKRVSVTACAGPISWTFWGDLYPHPISLLWVSATYDWIRSCRTKSCSSLHQESECQRVANADS